MKVRTRVSLFALALSLIPLLAVTVVLGWFSYSSAQEALNKQLESKLVSRREAKKTELESYFQTVNDQLLSQAQSNMLVSAAIDFNEAFAQQSFAGTDAIERFGSDAERSLDDYYQNDYANRYKEKNTGKSVDVDSIVSSLGERAKWFQYYYISDNEEALGEKDNMLSSSLGGSYDEVHELYHPAIQAFLKRFGFYDIFIIDPETGDVVYSVYKELDYATNLDSGPYRNSGLAQAYRAAKALGDSREVAVVDFKPYLPSYNDNAAFAATPILDIDGNQQGILVYQMALDRINQLMTLNQDWQSQGYGKTAELYLVGDDQHMRSDSRVFVESPNAFKQWGYNSSFGQSATDTVLAKGTTIAAVPVNTPAGKAVAGGRTGVSHYENYMGEKVIGAYTPLNINGLKWGIVAEIYQDEAFQAVESLGDLIALYGGITFVAVLIVAIAVGLWFAHGLSRPISRLSETVAEISANNDLTLSISEAGDEEVSQAASSVNALIRRLRENFLQISSSSGQLAQSADGMSELMNTNLQEIDAQNRECMKVAQSATQLEQAAHEVARNASETAVQTREANTISGRLADMVERSVASTQAVAGEIGSANEAMETLAERTSDIGSVLDVIQEIAEQTNLLALNAAIEAARAGEQGRGFAVVADEVRNLARRTQDATGEISSMIEGLQSDSGVAVGAMRTGLEKVKSNVAEAESSKEALAETMDIVRKISLMNEQVATAAEEQSEVIKEITGSTQDLSHLSDRSTERSHELDSISSQLSGLAGNLKTMVSAYKVG
ncbi:methyl-accepting chemotaxis protein [uncultured Pseudoteredinibacter sp.]|uniref:methyl-accepting chemotaxis protein n=1 Tax=uncultured Pseudoteredinibacter sp. TaxID=1641701 RepID=UPI002610EA42|nr:methyl-accepting chemotaxis protein [uncultured Pseudoteredinibacter sp.]